MAAPHRRHAAPTTAPTPSPSPKQVPHRREMPKVGRNAIVRIRKGAETQELKWKKAEALVRDEGWQLETVISE